MSTYKIAPSILSADFARLGEEVANVLKSGADIIHFDVMDNHFVPNLTIGAVVCKALRNYGIQAPIDVHLMVENPDSLIKDFADAGATHICVHAESCKHLDRSVNLIKALNCKAGIVLNPATPLEYLDYMLDSVDYILIMSVNPGFGGQSFIESALPKIARLKDKIGARAINIAVDGGVKLENIDRVAKAGADTFILGSGIFNFAKDDDINRYDSVIASLRAKLATI